VIKQTSHRFLVVAFECLLFLAPRIASAATPRLDSLPSDIERLYSSGSYQRAAELLQAVVERDPNDATHHYWLGRCYYESRDFDKAISSWERAVALDSSRSEYHDWLGRAYGRKAEQDSHSRVASALSLARRTHHELRLRFSSMAGMLTPSVTSYPSWQALQAPSEAARSVP
jgi:tetratricopeptide (TPR) repeat protein